MRDQSINEHGYVIVSKEHIRLFIDKRVHLTLIKIGNRIYSLLQRNYAFSFSVCLQVVLKC